MAGYKTRLKRDLDDWISKGLVPAENREAILDTVAESRRIDAATALAMLGAAMAGIAVIAFVAANWGEIPRLFRFVLIVGLFLAAAGAAAWASRDRPNLANMLLLVASLIYAAAIGLTGQIFDIAGDPQKALRGAGLAAGLLALAGRSSGAAVAALVLLAFGEFSNSFDGAKTYWLVYAAPVGLALAWLWNSRPLAHVASLALLVGVLMVLLPRETTWGVLGPLVVGVLFLGVAFAARQISDRQVAVIFMLWAVAGGLAFFGIGGLDIVGTWAVAHRAAWLAFGAGAVALGLHDRQPMMTAGGVLSLIGAASAILFDLGVGLMTAAGLFAASAVTTFAVGFILRRRAKA